MDNPAQRSTEIYLRKREIATRRGLLLGALLNGWAYVSTSSLIYWVHFGFALRFPEDVYKTILMQALQWGFLAGAVIGGAMGAKGDICKQIGRFTHLLFQACFIIGAMTAIVIDFDRIISFSLGRGLIALLLLLITYSLASVAVIIISPRVETWHSP